MGVVHHVVVVIVVIVAAASGTSFGRRAAVPHVLRVLELAQDLLRDDEQAVSWHTVQQEQEQEQQPHMRTQRTGTIASNAARSSRGSFEPVKTTLPLTNTRTLTLGFSRR